MRLSTITEASYRLKLWAHAWFDALWKTKGLISDKEPWERRRDAYHWLQEITQQPPEKAHFRLFDTGQTIFATKQVQRAIKDLDPHLYAELAQQHGTRPRI